VHDCYIPSLSNNTNTGNTQQVKLTKQLNGRIYDDDAPLRFNRSFYEHYFKLEVSQAQ
jgi:hypothetical protein